MNLKRNDIGVKLLNELMVDIIGGVIPGFLFIIVIFLSVVLPGIIYIEALGKSIGFSSLFNSSGFWWVLFLLCLILSYVIGHVFYREDISYPDKLDVDRQINDTIRKVKNKKYNIEQLKKVLRKEIEILRNRVSKIQSKEWNNVKQILICACNNAIKDLNGDIDRTDEYNTNILTILFPEDAVYLSGNILTKKEELSENSLEVLNKYESYFDPLKEFDAYSSPGIRYLVISYCILHCQMEIGCATKERCEFPYISYYKYLLKRNLLELVEHVNWITVEERTKNKINSLKIRVQIFANEAYAMINKNESHIRMSSSTWHITKPLVVVSSVSFVVFFSIIILYLIRRCRIDVLQYIAAILPLLMLFLVRYIRKKITKYIHYQRLREIQYTLQIYDQCKDIIKFRRENRAKS